MRPGIHNQTIRELKAESPPFRPNELASICYNRFSRRPSLHTIKRLLAEEPPLWDWGSGDWLSVIRAAPYARR